MTPRFLTATLAVALALPGAAHAQFSDSFNFIKAVRDQDGNKVTEILNKPGTVIVDTRDSATGETGLHIVTKRRDGQWLGFLLSRGAKPDLRDNNGSTALMIASQIGWTEGAATLLKVGAAVDASNSRGETPLILAVQNHDITTVRILLAAGANPKRPDNAAGLSARDYAARDPRSANILKELDQTKAVSTRGMSGPH